jgi:hypothetical protein
MHLGALRGNHSRIGAGIDDPELLSGCTLDDPSGCTLDDPELLSGCTLDDLSGCTLDDPSGCTLDDPELLSGCNLDDPELLSIYLALLQPLV